MLTSLRTFAFVSVTVASLASFAQSSNEAVVCQPLTSAIGNVDLLTVSRANVASLRIGNPRVGETVQKQDYAVQLKEVAAGKDLMILGNGFLATVNLTKVVAVNAAGEKLLAGKVKAQIAGQNIEINNLGCAVR